MSALPLAASTALKTAQLGGLANWLDDGQQTATLELYAGDWPGAGITGGTLLATIVLGKPSGTVAAGVLTLTANNAAGEMVMVSGIARWARCKTASGAWAFDVGITVAGGVVSVAPGGLVLSGCTEDPTTGGAVLYAGGRLPPASLLLR